MPKVTPGYQLYLYQLLSRELGCGKQTLLPQAEEVLAADDIIPADLECADMQELAKACPDFLKVTVFKKGRVYVTVIRNKDWDQMLAAPEEKPADKKAAAAGGPKSWRKKKNGKKTLKAVKPGKRRREREAAEAQAAALRAKEEARAAEEALRAAELAAQEAAAEASEAETQAEVVPPETDETIVVVEPNEQTPSPEAEAEPEPDKPVAKTLAEILAEAREAEQAATPTPANEPEPIQEIEPTLEPEDLEPKPDTPAAAEPAVEEEAIPAAPAPSPISITITYDPYEDMERELAAQAAQQEQIAQQEAAKPQPAPAPAPATPPVSPIPLAGLPQDFGQEVSCSDALLRVLYQLLPFDAEPLAILDEDWRVARSTGSLSGSRNRVSFPLRYLHKDGTALTATLRKSTRTTYGKPWSLILVDGDDGSGLSHDAIGFEGLPTADEGAWADLATTTPQLSPMRELAQQVVIGSWDTLLGSLATMAAPERWNYPGEGVGQQSRYGILRDYLCVTFHRLQCQERIAQAPDGSFAAFNTGLTTSFGDEIYACLGARKGDIPWQFLGFATAGSGELGVRLVASFSPLPERASYLGTLEDVTPDASRMAICDLESILTSQLGRLPRAFLRERLEGNAEANAILSQGATLSKDDLARLARAIKADGSAYRRLRRALDDSVEQALRATKVSFRLAAPVYDPAENRTKLLVPLCLVEEGAADCALVLDLQPSGAYRAAVLLSLARAYSCARVISREQPRWLEASRVL